MSTNGNDDLIADYLGEAQDYLEQLNTILMDLAESGEAGLVDLREVGAEDGIRSRGVVDIEVDCCHDSGARTRRAAVD